MTDLRTAAQQALEALDGLSEDAICQSSHHAKKDRHTSLDVCPVFLRLRAAFTALRAALADGDKLSPGEPVQEPVAYWNADESSLAFKPRRGGMWVPLYADSKPCPTCVSLARAVMMDQTGHDPAPPQRKPLTEEEIYKMYNALWRAGNTEAVAFARAIERAHGIGDNT